MAKVLANFLVLASLEATFVEDNVVMEVIFGDGDKGATVDRTFFAVTAAPDGVGNGAVRSQTVYRHLAQESSFSPNQASTVLALHRRTVEQHLTAECHNSTGVSHAAFFFGHFGSR